MISLKAGRLSSFIVMDVMARAAELEKAGEKVIHLEVGEPDFPTPAVIQDEAVKAMREGRTKYTHAMGLPELREEICMYYKKKYSVDITPNQVLVTSGTSPAFLFAMIAIMNDKDQVIVSNPGYACYPNFITATGGEMVEVATNPGNGFQYTADDIRKNVSGKTRAIVINSPSNPTGVVMNHEQLREISRFSDQYIISDEIYHGLVYKDEAHSILEYTERAFVINGFSKLYAMTGWRLGYCIFPPEFSDVMQKIHQNFMISANSFVQWAGIAALTKADDDVEAMRSTYDTRRRYMIDRLRDMGFVIHVEPTGAFYVFADARKFCSDSYAEAFNIINTVKVGVTPGIDFGSGGEGFLRFSYANSIENIKEGLDRLEEYLVKK